jgi:hypothetical protein
VHAQDHNADRRRPWAAVPARLAGRRRPSRRRTAPSQRRQQRRPGDRAWPHDAYTGHAARAAAFPWCAVASQSGHEVAVFVPTRYSAAAAVALLLRHRDPEAPGRHIGRQVTALDEQAACRYHGRTRARTRGLTSTEVEPSRNNELRRSFGRGSLVLALTERGHRLTFGGASACRGRGRRRRGPRVVA